MKLKVLVLTVLSGLMLVPGAYSFIDQNTNSDAAASNRVILRIVLREYQQGQPISGAKLEILSYNWQVQPGQAEAVIAEGETGSDGSVSFDVTTWPASGYRFRFSPTPSTKPAGLYFMPDGDNQFRGYPGNIIEGSDAARRGENRQEMWFVLVTNGLVELDLSDGQGRPEYQEKVPEVGLGYYAGFTPVDGQSYVATAIAATAVARAGGASDPTRPAPPSTYTPGQPQQALPQVTRLATHDLQLSSPPDISPTPVPASTTPTGESRPVEAGQRIVQTVLAILALAFLAGFIRYRHHLYRLVGIENKANLHQRKRKPAKKKIADLVRVEKVIRPEGQEDDCAEEKR